jgi:Flp pilus assembly protein TadG
MLGLLSKTLFMTSTIGALSRRTLSLCTGLGAFGADRSGNIGMIFAFTLVPVIGIVGFSVDYGRALDERTTLQTALDGAVLAAGRHYQVSGSASSAEDAAAEYFSAAMQGHSGVEIVENAADAEASTMRFTGRVKVQTTFARVLGVKELVISTTAESMLANGGLDKNLEISLMLDITGSMCQPCSKIADLKDAAKDLINILVQDDQSKYTSRVALVPFSHAVNAGETYFESVTDKSPDDYSTCVVERAGTNKFTDAQPGSGDQTYLSAFDTKRKGASPVSSSTECAPQAEIMPLSADKVALNASIDSYQAEGWTAGQLGTAWAWYMLSPKWNSFWPSESQAADYHDDETAKIAVLMTDGDYNAAYQTANGSSAEQAKQLCANMKKEGITVYTVGFMVSSSAKQLLEECATSSSHFYDATNGEKLKIAFRNIAFTVAQLRLSK